MAGVTHNLGFFFGPGRLLSRIGPFGSMEGGARFRPVTPAPPLLRRSPLGGASVLVSVPSVTVGGIGVPFESDALSADSVGGSEGDGVGLAMGAGGGLGAMLDGKRASMSGEMRSFITRLFLAVFEFALAEAGVDMAVVVWCVYGSLSSGCGCGSVGVGVSRITIRDCAHEALALFPGGGRSECHLSSHLWSSRSGVWCWWYMSEMVVMVVESGEDGMVVCVVWPCWNASRKCRWGGYYYYYCLPWP